MNFCITNKILEGNYSVDGSKYFGYGFPVSSLKQIKSNIKIIKTQHSTSDHICYAYRILGKNSIEEYVSDANEPKGSAGYPILNVIRQKNIINVIILIVRYFGGNKLGIRGLIKSYSMASKITIDSAILEPYIEEIVVVVSHNYKYQKIIQHTLKKLNGKILSQKYSNDIKSTVSVPKNKSEKFINQLSDTSKGEITFKLTYKNLNSY